MATRIERVLTPEERLLLEPHIRKAVRLDRMRDQAQQDLLTVLRVLEPRTGGGLAFDGELGVWMSEISDGPEALIAEEVKADG